MIDATRRVLQIYSSTYRHLRQAAKLERSFGNLPRANLRELKRSWALDMLRISEISIDVRGDIPAESGMILVGNHLSYLDIPLVMSALDVSFVAKAELAHWPAIGSGCRRTETILVTRTCEQSRRVASTKIAEAVLHRNQNVVIFPSGTTSIDETRQWKPGSLRIARDHNLNVLPFRIWYAPVRPAAYIDRDFFPLHLYQLQRVACRFGEKVKAVIEFGQAIKVEDPKNDASRLRDWCNAPSFRSASIQVESGQSWSPLITSITT